MYEWKSLFLILPWKLIERPHFLGISGIGVKIESVPKYFFFFFFEFHHTKVHFLFFVLEFKFACYLSWVK